MRQVQMRASSNDEVTVYCSQGDTSSSCSGSSIVELSANKSRPEQVTKIQSTNADDWLVILQMLPKVVLHS